jgi:hypothetical protein
LINGQTFCFLILLQNSLLVGSLVAKQFAEAAVQQLFIAILIVNDVAIFEETKIVLW